MFYLNSALNFRIPPVLVFQLEVYYKVDRLLTGLTAQQKGTTARWYSNKTSLDEIQLKTKTIDNAHNFLGNVSKRHERNTNFKTNMHYNPSSYSSKIILRPKRDNKIAVILKHQTAEKNEKKNNFLGKFIKGHSW